jgi:6-phosphogluconolactonase (cycloisomerase 2 family)
MIDRRTFTTLLGGAVVAPMVSPAAAQARSSTVFYSAVGPNLTLYEMNVGDATLARRGTVTVPANIQYVWPHPSKKYLYVVSSNRRPGFTGDKNFANAFRISANGALEHHGEPAALPSRAIHTTVDIMGEYLLTAFNDPSSLTVHQVKGDGTIGDEIKQGNPLDTGKYAHQIRVTPDNQQVILVTRGNNAPEDKVVNPGSLKVYDFLNGVLSNAAVVQPGDGMTFGPRHLDFHPTQPWVYVSVESQNKLAVYRRHPTTGLSRDPLFVKETLVDPKARGPRQHAGTIHVHPNGRFVYLTNRDSGTVDFQGQKINGGGQNNVAVFAIDQNSGEPTLIQTADAQAIELRTFAIDPSGRLLVAGSVRAVPVRDGNAIKTVPAGLSAFRIGNDGKLEFVRKYDIDTGAETQWWTGMVTLA